MIAAFAFFIAYAWSVLDTSLSPLEEQILFWTQIALWALFVIDYLVRLALCPEPWTFVKRNWFDLLVISLPMFRPLRLLQLLAVLRVFDRHAGNAMRGKVATYAIGTTLIVLIVSALAILDVERNAADTQIQTFPQALWWAIATVTTVGYGDTVPVSADGRVIAIALMIFGIALLGVVTGLLSSWIIQKVTEEDPEDETSQILQKMSEQEILIRELTQEVKALREGLSQQEEQAS
ncbi:hypothetical protein BK816_02570 [Boudabousia tangfeifanii]|uniref:Potassium channel domain-containing protein n=2 Tax=Boudabousia tangfeifanii TaxID=1912795 RepID=A0A1D9MM32_9ACTO|nr:hypothetical protein BK816_02570 [Boudabousia tangfeifanii]